MALILVLAAHLAVAPALAQTPPAAPEAPAEADPVQHLLDVLRDDAARMRLLERLEAEVAPPAADATPEPATAAEPVSLGRRIAGYTERAVEGAAAWGRDLGDTVRRAPAAFAGLGAEELGIIRKAVRDLLLILVVTAGTFTALRAVAIPYYRRLGERVAGRAIRHRVGPFLLAGAIDFSIVLVAWAIGNGVALLVFGEQRQVALTQVLYLTAFLAVELVKAAFRLVLSPATQALRPVHLGDWAATRLYRVIRMVTSILGYGVLLAVPIIADEAGFLATRSMAALIWVAAILYLIWAVLHYRRPVGDWLLRQLDRAPSGAATEPSGLVPDPVAPTVPPAEDYAAAVPAPLLAADAAALDVPGMPPAATGQGANETLRTLAHGWSWLALAWLAWLLVTVVKQRPGAVGRLLEDSGRVALALVAAFAVSGLLGRWIARGIHLPQSLRERVPLLERRLNRYMPWFLLAARLLIVAGVLVYAALTLGLVARTGWVQGLIGPQVSGKIVSVLAIVLVGFLVWLALSSWVEYRLNSGYGKAPTSREQTLLTLLRNAATIAILALAFMFVLSEIGVNIGPLIASAGVVGLAIGFGAQKMVQDIITGIFIQFENAINVGDVVTAGGVTGSVERLTVRSVSLRDGTGTYHIIPFSSVDSVANQSRDYAFWSVSLGVGYGEDAGAVKQAALDAFAELRRHPEQAGFVIGDLEWWGLDSFGTDSVKFTGRIKTWPGRNGGVGRAYNEIVKRIFDERGIEIPFPQRTIWLGEDKAGSAPPLRLARDKFALAVSGPDAPGPEPGPRPRGRPTRED